MSEPFVERLRAELGPSVLGVELLSGRECAVLAPEALSRAASLLRDDSGLAFDMLIDLAGADYSGYGGEKAAPLCVSYQLYSSSRNVQAWLKVYVAMEGASVPSLTPLYAAANWFERECWDMYGVVFQGHPYLKRLLLYEEFSGHPLRKDYPILKAQPLIPMRNAVDYEAVHSRMRQQSGEA